MGRRSRQRVLGLASIACLARRGPDGQGEASPRTLASRTYERLHQTFSRMSTLGDVSMSSVGTCCRIDMPVGGLEARGKQLAELRMMNELIRDAR